MTLETGEDEMEKKGSFINAKAAQPATQTFISIAVAMLGAIMFGIDCANFGSVIGFDGFKDQWCVGRYGTEDECFGKNGQQIPAAWDTVFVNMGNTLLTLGAACGSILLAPTVANGKGRRACISLGSFIVFLSCILSDLSPLFGGADVYFFFFSRAGTGFGIGVCCFALPIYNSEIATPDIRGRMGSLFQWNTVFGSWAASIILLYMQDWYIGMLLPGAAGLIVSALIWTVPESPRWELMYKGEEAALATLRRLRVGSEEQVKKEVDAINEEIAKEKAASDHPMTFGELISGDAKIRVFTALMMQICQQLTGVNAILGQSNTFFSKFNIPNPFVFNQIWTFFQLITVSFGVYLIDHPKSGRRPQLTVATILMAPTLFAAAILVNANVNWIWGAIMLTIYACGFQLAWGLVPWLYPSEIFTMSERAKAMGVSVFFQYGANSLVYFTSPWMIHWSITGTCVIFGVINAYNLFFVQRYVLETKGVPLEMIPAKFDEVRRRRQPLANDAR